MRAKFHTLSSYPELFKAAPLPLSARDAKPTAVEYSAALFIAWGSYWPFLLKKSVTFSDTTTTGAFGSPLNTWIEPSG